MFSGIAHRVLSDIHIDGLKIPRNTIVLLNLYGLNMDENYWAPDATIFRPERFLDQDGNLIHHENFIPFGKK